MAGNGLTSRLMALIVVLLGLAMALQSAVLVYFGVRAAIREEVVAGKLALEAMAKPLSLVEKENLGRAMARLSSTPGQGTRLFSCLTVTLPIPESLSPSPCSFAVQHRFHAETALAEGKTSQGYVGNDWNIFLLNHQGAIFAVPLRDEAGAIIGALSGERSFTSIYQRYWDELRLAGVYLAVNLVIFALVAFFRFDRSLFRPLELLLRKTEEYHPDQMDLLPIREGDTIFRRLSLSFHSLLERIENDNRKLRATVRQLEDANSELRQRNELVVRSEKLATAGRLSAGLAHEIGNPLSIIQGYAELLAREDLTPEERRRFSEKAQQELDRIKGLIRSLLDFARPGDKEPAEVAVHGLIDDVISFLSVQKGFSGCRVNTDFLASEDRVLVDGDALRQVLINCLLNALDAVSALAERQAELTIATGIEAHGPSRRSLVIRVRDNGGGIAAGDLPNIFDPFFTTKDGGRGTGLGLYVCHTIMERIGGSITVSPRTPLEGVEVKLVLPLPPANNQVTPAADLPTP